MAQQHYLFISIGVFFLSLFLLRQLCTDDSHEQKKELNSLLKLYELEHLTPIIYFYGCTSPVTFVNICGEQDIPDLSKSSLRVLRERIGLIKDHLILKQWLKKKELYDADTVFNAQGINSIKLLQNVDITELKYRLNSAEFNTFLKASRTLSFSPDEIALLNKKLWQEIEENANRPWTTVGTFILSLCIALFSGMVLTMSQPRLIHPQVTSSKLGFLSYVTGRYLSPSSCKVVFDWKEPQSVGNTMSFTVKFYQRNGQAYPICNEDNILIEVTQGTYKIACSIEYGGPQISDANKAKVHFTVRRSGEYQICVLICMTHIRGSPFKKEFIPGPPDPIKTSFVQHCSTVVGSEDVPTQLFIEPRDKYGNLCTINNDCDPANEYSVDIIEVNTGRPIADSFRWECYPLISRLALVLKFPKEGCYRATISYKGQTIQNGDFNIIVLNSDESSVVQKNVSKRNKCYEVKLIALNGERNQKAKKVYCYISPKQLTLKEYVLKFFPKHLVTFRLCPSTKFKFQSRKDIIQADPVLIIDDGCQEVELISPDRNIIVATFTQFLLKNIGGSETFKDKQDFFHHEVRKYHQKHFHDKVSVKISRENILESSLKETKGFSVSDWCKNFEITFIDEEGVDWGGLKREWFELVCTSLFSPENSLFHSFKSDKQGLVHPCPGYKRPPNLKLKYFEFAGKIVGKCLYESSLGSTYRQLVKAKFSRSFLAQLIGLSVHYKEVDLIPNGYMIPVTKENKLQYLNALAQYRLTTSVKSEIEHFLKGLTELIPDNLLCIFDENELELLMCGTGSYSIADFKANHAVSGSSYEFRKVLEWFWIAVSNFSEEEMARLLQFATGCSQLPPGGFSELSPKFHITAAPTFGNLPTAHTCFNQLCLPDYDSYEQFERALRLAINEGSEGFGMV
ncbi:apoptosis-resistant E3 ubiquitin protein ligase 1 isoform X3 [Parasteatoda tepidariorum]|uniref:apoptosis-resistant E3 ubiquitin protein ligase 1 isoform X3 n=1 Tax=Parasteatoda tepidariorum TaxID=114398 RepID=UPI0039BC46A1